MNDPAEGFDLETFLPYLLNQAAEAASRGFQGTYRSRFGFTRAQWRVLANLGKFGDMSARDICAISQIEKTKVSRAVAVLEQRDILERTRSKADGRAEVLSLTPHGRAVFDQLGGLAVSFDNHLREMLGQNESIHLTDLLRRVIASAPDGSTQED